MPARATLPVASARKPPLPPAATHRVPRKHTVRLRKELVVSGLVFLVLTYVLRILRRSHHHDALAGAIKPRRTLDELREVPRNVYYLTKEPVQFCYIPKNACSALKPLLRKREGFADWADPALIHGKRNGLQRLQWLARTEALARLNATGVYRFVVVRDPFARLVSAWQNKVAQPWPEQRQDFWSIHLRRECPALIDARQMPAEGPLLSLRDFLECLNSPDTLLPSNEHWRPQSELCALDHVRYDRYLRVESLADDVTSLLDDLRWNERRDDFQFDRKAIYEKPLAEFFDEGTIRLALRYYQNDFDILRYDTKPSGNIGFFSVYNESETLAGNEARYAGAGFKPQQ